MKWCTVFSLATLSCMVNLTFTQMCKQLNSSEFGSCVAANFTHTIDSLTSNDYYVRNYSKMIDHLNEQLDNCSPYISTIVCSLYVPKCIEGQFEPFLPCRRVCREFVYGCREKLLKQGLSWLISLCPILPDKSIESGKCFEPEGFKPEHVNEPFIKHCDSRVDSITTCTAIGYETFWNSSSQQEINAAVGNRINEVLHSRENCRSTLEKLVCAKYAPPCLDVDDSCVVGALCRSRCFSLSNACPSALGPGDNIDLFSYCTSAAEGNTKNGFCQYSQWPSARHWPKGPWVKRLSSYFPEGLIAVLVLVPILSVIGICVAVMVRRKLSRNGAGYKKQTTKYDAGADTVTFT